MTNAGGRIEASVTYGSLLLEHAETLAPEFDLNRSGTYSGSL